MSVTELEPPAADTGAANVAADESRTYTLSPELVTLSDARPAEAEAIRTMRTHIMARHLEDGRRGLTMCSATKGVGCTFMAANLAVALAQIGIKTLLIDADLRDPGVQAFFHPN